MAFRLRPGESVAHGLRRLAKKELRSAWTELRKTDPPPDEAIHDARNSVKKVRAVMDLIRDLRRTAIARAARIYRSKPRTYERRVKKAWSAWRKQDRGPRRRIRRAA
jgi:hypothetical protein